MTPVFEATSVGSDHNMLAMATMRRLAPRHGLMLLIHEKPFAGINGSGKHNNWSMATDGGENLLDPGHDPHANAQFLAFLLAVVRAVNVHADVLRATIADAANDHRLGANEAPPAIMSVFLGSQLVDVISQLERGGSAAPIYWPQTALNTAVAESLALLADELEKLPQGDFDGLTRILARIARDNKQVLFEGNGYAE